MKITEVTVHASRTFNNPFEPYANMKPGVSLKASVEDGDDPFVIAQHLQHKAEELVEDQKQEMLKNLEYLNEIQAQQSQISSIERQMKNYQEQVNSLQERLAELKNPKPFSQALPSSGDETDDEPRLGSLQDRIGDMPL